MTKYYNDSIKENIRGIQIITHYIRNLIKRNIYQDKFDDHIKEFPQAKADQLGCELCIMAVA